jgi:hypothetical protein
LSAAADRARQEHDTALAALQLAADRAKSCAVTLRDASVNHWRGAPLVAAERLVDEVAFYAAAEVKRCADEEEQLG